VARLHRQDLKHDDFVDSMDSLELWLEDNLRLLVAFALAGALTAGALGGYWWYAGGQETRAQTALGNALITLSRPVQEGLPALNVPGTARTFASETDRYRAARDEFAAVRADFPRTRAARLAKHYEALCDFHLGETGKAVAALEELARAADPNLSSLASFHLAGFYQALGRRSDAEKIYRRLADHPTELVPRPMALVALADIESASNPMAARQLLEQVKAEFPDGPVAEEISRRLDLLPAPPNAPPAAPQPAPAQP